MSLFPQVTQGRVDQNLTNVLLAYTNKRFVADRIFPTVGGLSDDSGLIPKMGKANLRQYAAKRELWDDTDHRVTFSIDTSDRYAIEYFDLSTMIPDRIMKQWKLPFDAHLAAQNNIIENLKLIREAAVADALTSTAVMTNNLDFTSTAARQWSTATTSTPLADIQAAKDSVFSKTGMEANRIILERKAANTLRNHAEIKAIAYASLASTGNKKAEISIDGLVEILKAHFNFEDVIITQAVRVSSKEGQTETLGVVWGPDCVVYYAPSVPGLMTPSFGYSFQLADEVMRSVVRRAPSDKGDVVEVSEAHQDKIIDVNAGFLIKGVVVA
jgi:hypothetical protein